jgi:hypothetical protein
MQKELFVNGFRKTPLVFFAKISVVMDASPDGGLDVGVNEAGDNTPYLR